MNLDVLSISNEVKEALLHHKPIVALESTIISHGMPFPKNLETAKKAEQILRKEGVTPATIAILNGKLKVGLTLEELTYLAKKGRKVIKTSRRDIPYIVSLGLDGATTVSATMLIASLASIKVFATGGIGGVHRGVSETMDISCDLEELGKTNVAVVCSGAKAILDIPKTLEYLETKGVLVIGYKTDVLPLFYTSKSPYPVNIRMDHPKEIAKTMKTKWDLGLKGGILITNPIPKEYEMDPVEMNNAIQKAIEKMNERKIIGKETTPFLLEEIANETQGKSLDANIHLVHHNCYVAAQIAKEYYSEKL